jgi:membrane associated rhomboid family serine protease
LRELLGSKKEESYDTSHRMCPNCRALVARGAYTCSFCGARLTSLRARGDDGRPTRIMGVIPIPSTVTAALGLACVAMYALEWYLSSQTDYSPGGGLFSLGGINPLVMIRLGAKYGYFIVGFHQYWRLVTAVFLHAGLLHIGMNMWCLFDLGPEMESLFSTSKFIFIYLVTGVFGFIVSLFWSPGGISIGASGAIMGMIGALIAASFHLGSLGKAYRSSLWRWVLYILVLGFFFNVDNAAHVGGLLSGLGLGYILPQGAPATRVSETLWNAVALVCVLIMAGSFALMALQMNQPLR